MLQDDVPILRSLRSVDWTGEMRILPRVENRILSDYPLYLGEGEEEDHNRAVLVLHESHIRFSELQAFAEEHANDKLGSPDEEDRSWSKA
ncbi:hypothetical protein E4U60_004172 [Claviceps pazoutovae]|uniref:Uncharacterized protein n=1 Tax=Claviceps pazoutovae TaxID=1649127 RepID=A0A9P7M984_9HYPO|nr:hypothetical protein E4U60_004172 [Claviceps pazoutovae]